VDYPFFACDARGQHDETMRGNLVPIKITRMIPNWLQLTNNLVKILAAKYRYPNDKSIKKCPCWID
jgi:hypothetical protein